MAGRMFGPRYHPLSFAHWSVAVSGDDPATCTGVIREPHEPLSSMLTGYPPALENLLDRALAKIPSIDTRPPKKWRRISR